MSSDRFIGDPAEYQERNYWLKEAGYATYRDYLQSKTWKKIRRAVLDATPNCYGCAATATQVHHGEYTREILDGSIMDKGLSWKLVLFAVCRKCHKRAEKGSRGRKRTPSRATRWLHGQNRRWFKKTGGRCRCCGQPVKVG